MYVAIKYLKAVLIDGNLKSEGHLKELGGHNGQRRITIIGF